MTDQTVKISNLPDSGTPERVAYDMWAYMRGLLAKESGTPARVQGYLDLYAQCLLAARGVAHDASKLK